MVWRESFSVQHPFAEPTIVEIAAAAACVLAGAIVFNRASAKTELAHAVELVSKLQHSHRNLQDEVTRLQFSGQDPAANQPADDEQA